MGNSGSSGASDMGNSGSSGASDMGNSGSSAASDTENPAAALPPIRKDRRYIMPYAGGGNQAFTEPMRNAKNRYQVFHIRNIKSSVPGKQPRIYAGEGKQSVGFCAGGL